MGAIIEIDEANGEDETLTHNISNSNMGNIDMSNLPVVDYPVTPGHNTYEKWQKIHVTDMGGSTKILNLKVWRSSALGGLAVHLTNAKISDYIAAVFAKPENIASIIATQEMPTGEPASANLGIGGSLAGELINPGYSDYLVHQIQTNVADTVAALCAIHFQYDEIA